MNKNQHNRRAQSLNPGISQAEIERKWRRLQEELEMMEMLESAKAYQAVVAVSSSGGGGSSQTAVPVPVEPDIITLTTEIDGTLYPEFLTSTGYIGIIWWDSATPEILGNGIPEDYIYSERLNDGTPNDATFYSCDSNGIKTGEINWFLCGDLTDLDVSKCLGLEELRCNYGSLTSLDVSNLPLLNYVDAGNNLLTSVNFSNLPSLSQIHLENNPLGSLDIDASGLSLYLSCFNSSLTSLNITGTPASLSIECQNNFLTSLDVSGFTGLTNLLCQDNLLTSLGVSGCSSLTELKASRNSLSSLDLSGCLSLSRLEIIFNNLTSVSFPSVTQGSFNLDDNQLPADQINSIFTSLGNWSGPLNGILVRNNPGTSTCTPSIAESKDWLVYTEPDVITLTTAITGEFTFSLQTNSGYAKVVWWDSTSEILGDGNVDSFITFLKANDGTSRAVTVYSCNSVEDLSGIIIQFESVESGLTSLDVTVCSLLTNLNCTGNSLTSLDFSGLPRLAAIDCTSNQLTSLDISQNILLFSLYCNNNSLTSLDLSQNLSLSYLICNNNLLTLLDISQNIELINLYCNNNLLTSVSVPPLTDGIFNLNANQLSASSLNSFFTELGIVTDLNNNRTIEVFNNPGSLTCTPSIARNKDWLVYTEPDVVTLITAITGNFTCSLRTSTGYAKVVWWDSPTPQILGDGDPNNFINFLKANDGTSREVTAYSCNSVGDRTGTIPRFDSNSSGLTSLDVSRCIGLDNLNCFENSLTSLDISQNILLFSLYCNNNSLTSLDLSQNLSLSYLICNNNLLTLLDISQNIELFNLYCNNNSLTSLDVSQNPALNNLTCNNNLLTTLDLSNNPSLGYLVCNNNLLTSLDISQAPDLFTLTCNDNLLTSISVYPLINGLLNLNANQLSASSLNSFFTELGIVTDLNNNRTEVYNNPGSLTCTPSIARSKGWAVFVQPDIVTLTTDVNGTFYTNIESSTGYVGVVWWTSPTPQIFGDGDPGAPIEISKEGNDGTPRDVTFYSCNSGGTGSGRMISIDVADQAITDLNVLDCTGIEILDCSDNLLTTLDLSNLGLLSSVNSSDMLVPLSITLTGCFGLSILDVGSSQIPSIDLSSCPSLTDFNCSYSTLTSLNLLNNPLLIDLNFNSCSLTSIDLSGNPLLYDLRCTNNLLTSLDLSSNSQFMFLYANNNLLESVNVSGCSSLFNFFVPGNNLTTVDLTDCISIFDIRVEDNDLTSLNLSGLNTLRRFTCSNNQITSLNISDVDFPLFDYLAGINNPMTSLNATGASSGDIQIQSCLFDSSGLNALFTSLDNVDPTAENSTLFIYGNPGTATCDPTIATAKGWTVNTTTP